MQQNKWKIFAVAESENAYWEIVHDSDNKTVKLIYVPEDDYTDKDVTIELPYDRFEDLIKFIESIK